MLFADHELVGKIWDVRQKAFVSRDTLKQAVLASDYILLGETHDNSLHHQGQTWVIDQLANSHRSAIVAFEMIAQQQGSFIADKEFDSADALIVALDHVKTNWEYGRLYKSVFASAISAGYGIFSANMDRQQIVSIARQGEAEISDTIKRIMDDAVMSPEQVSASQKEIAESHCGMINETMTSAMMLVQRTKDAVMAASLDRHKDIDVRVLVAGSGHVRNDRGVPLYLQKQALAKNVLTITWAEVQADATTAAAYADYWGSTQLPFDYVWFTPRIDRPDPCEEFKRHMKSKRSE